MRYILSDNGYIESVSFSPIEYNGKTCKEYTGAIPSGYNSLEDWAINANIAAYEIVNNNLVYDEIKDAEIKRKEEITIPYHVYKDGEHIVGDWFGDELYRNIYRGKISSTDKEVLQSNIINNDLVLQNGTVHNQSGTQLGLGYNKEGYGSQVYINNGELTLSHTSDIIGDYHVILEYIKSKGYLVKGNSYQETTKGYQVFNLPDKTSTNYGITTITQDGITTLNGTFTETQAKGVYFVSSNLPNFKAGETYTLKVYGLTNTNVYVQMNYNNGTTDKMLMNRGNDKARAYTIPDNFVKATNFFIGILPNENIINQTLKIMLVKGEYTDETMPDFEKFTYGASPNPNYPQPIEVVDNVKIKVGNKETTIDLKGNCVSKLGDIQDYLLIHKNKYWLVKNVGKVVLNGSESWSLQSINSYGIANFLFNHKLNGINDKNAISSHFIQQQTAIANTKNECMYWQNNAVYIRMNETTANTVEKFKQWLSTHNVTVYYQLAQSQLIELGELPEEVEVSDDVQLISNLDTRIVVTDNFNFNDYMN